MVGGVEAHQPAACQSFTVSSIPRCTRRAAQTRTVDGSGDRVASATKGTHRSQLLSGWRNNSQASCLQWKL